MFFYYFAEDLAMPHVFNLCRRRPRDAVCSCSIQSIASLQPLSTNGFSHGTALTLSHSHHRQSQVDAAVIETRKIVSASEAIARRLRSEMDGRGGELSGRRRVAMEGLAVRPARIVEGTDPSFYETDRVLRYCSSRRALEALL